MNEELKKQNLIVQLTFAFAVKAVGFCTQLDEIKKWLLANQLLRSSLSIGANVREAQNAESKAGFIHKMKIAAKETDEVEYYLEICHEAPELPSSEILMQEIQSIAKVLNKIISSSKISKRADHSSANRLIS